MGGKILSNCRVFAIIPRTWYTKSWTREKVEKWVKAAGGVLQKEFDEHNTTHLVVEDQAWKNKVRCVQLALEANGNGGKIHIVSPDWLHTCLDEQRKCREGSYLWEKLEQEAAGEKRKKRGKQSGEGGEAEGVDGVEGGPKSYQAMLGEVLQEGTEHYLADHDRRALEAEIVGKEKAEQEREEEEARRKEREKKAAEQQRKARADIMKKSVKKGRGEVFNATYHAYQDSTGFAYEIMLTKVDTLTNSNERLNLTLFESNEGVPNTSNPPTYATNLHFAGTGKQPRNNILAALGSNFYTSTRMFRKAFKEKTGVSWDDRIKAHNERVRNRNRDGGTPGPHSTRRGENGDIKSKTRAAEDEVPFEIRKFEYMPPIYGPRGWLPDGKESMPEVLRQIRAKPDEQRDRTEQWMMSGGNGNGPDALPLSPRQSMEQAQFSAPVNLTEDDPADQLDNSVTTGNENDLDGGLAGASFDPTYSAEAMAGDVFSNGTNMNAGEFNIDSLLADTQGWPAQENVFDVGDLASQQQHQFVFSQDAAGLGVSSGNVDFGGMYVAGGDPDAKEAASAIDGTDLQTTMPAGDLFSNNASFAKQTQLAAMVGEDLLNFERPNNAMLDDIMEQGPCETAADGLVVVPEAEQLEATASVGKRDRSENYMEDMEPAAKRFEGEEFPT